MSVIKINIEDEFATVELSNGVSNPINSVLIKELFESLSTLEEDKSVIGVILKGQDNYFSVGLDLFELHSFTKEQLAEFWVAYFDLVKKMYDYSKPLITFINGHCPAGGCIFALCSDYRIMIHDDKYKIGLNETMVGIPVPQFVFNLYKAALGESVAYKSLLQGRLFSPIEAYDIGLIDACIEKKDSVNVLKQVTKTYGRVLPQVFKLSKRNMRKVMSPFTGKFVEEIDGLVEVWFHPKNVELRTHLIQSLKS